MKGCRSLALVAACVGAALFTLLPAQHGRGGEPAPPAPDTARLVRDLGSTDYKAREAATRRLLEWETLPPALRAALKSGDAEVARRARRIIRVITQREENAAFGKLTEFARRGEIDRLAELLVRRPKWGDEDACWQALVELNAKLFDLESKVYRRTSFTSRPRLGDGAPPQVRTKLRRRVAARRASIDLSHMDVRAEHIVVKTTDLSYLVSTRSTQAQSIFESMLVGGGTLDVWYSKCLVIVCDGDVKCSNANRSLIIARGDVQFSGSVINCHVIAGGSVRFLPAPEYQQRRDNQVTEQEPNPLGFIKWFDPASVGVTVEAAPGGVRVKAAAKSFAAAGLRAGDLLTALDGEAVKSPDDFRLLLRAKLADGGKMALAVRRAGQDLKITVRCKD
jgi:hypothetical protein